MIGIRWAMLQRIKRLLPLGKPSVSAEGCN